MPVNQKIARIDVPALLAILADNCESALVDVREDGVRARDGHLIHSVSLPLSQLELRAGTLLPRLSARIVVIDAGDGALAQRAANKLQTLGFSAVSVLAGGVEAWRRAGLELYTGDSAYSKAFGEFVEHTYGTPHISAQELKQRLQNNDDLLLLDGRTLAEFRDFSIPGAHAVPNAELPYRVHSLLKSPHTQVVVNCAGRTRSIIGAQALINAGLRNPVAALENGTMDWLTSGFSLSHGELREAPAPQGETLAKAQESVGLLTRRFGLQWLDGAQLDAFRRDCGQRSLFIYDVRTRAEYEAGHLADALWAEGGQLVQGIDKFVGVRNSRIVVVDDGVGARAAITASWLAQLGWGEVFAHVAPRHGEAWVTGAPAAPLLQPAPQAEPIDAAALAAGLRDGVVVLIDLASSRAYEAGHIPGAHFAVRSALDAAQLQSRAGHKALVLTSPDGLLAKFAAAELAPSLSVRVLEGGTAAWQAANLPLESGATSLLHPADDVFRSPYEVSDRHAAFRDYLDWERNLLKQLARDRTVRFRTFTDQENA